MSHQLHEETCEHYNNNNQNQYPTLTTLNQGPYQSQPVMNQRPYQGQSVINQQPYQGQPVVSQPYPTMNQQGYPMNQQTYFMGQPNMPRQMTPVSMVVVADTKICGLQIPFLEQTTALIFLIMNLIILPGLGTMLVGCFSQNTNCFKWVLLGIAQLLTGMCCVGWIWSIYTSIQLLQFSQSTTQMAQMARMNQMHNMNTQMSGVIGRPVEQTDISQ